AWVEQGRAPDAVIGTEASVHLFAGERNTAPGQATARRTRPVYPYPRWTKYKGSGNPNDAASFEPAEPR
ncbi:MAG: tannase/feruloyl esterase family alpha/beta hydrolase, partial [Gemmatimonadota bacterium]